MAVTFQGTYTKQSGTQPATGSVSVTPDGGSATVTNLDASGHFTAALAYAERYTVVETLDGASDTKIVEVATDGETVDLSRDTGEAPAPSSSLKVGTITITEVTGAPTIAGAVGDIALRKDGTGNGTSNFYVCTVAGAAGAATWVATA